MENKKEGKSIKIFKSLCNRSGFDDWWDNIDPFTKKEIKMEIENIIQKDINSLLDSNR
jgi:hypothetical protein